MKHYRLNQIAMAVLGALLLIFGTKTLINIAFEEHRPEKPETEVAGAKHEEKPGEKQAAAGASELPALLAKGDAKRGETTAAVCKACHSFDAGVPSPIGPNLHNVVGRKIASVEGFNYSPALKSKEGNWTYENLDHWLTNPQVFAQGTTMGFPGLPDAQQRGDVILFLRSKTDNPPQLPAVVAAAPAAKAAKPAEDAKPGGEAAPGAEILPVLAKADPKKGEGEVALCKVCHSFDKGTPSPVGPNLYGVVGRKIASLEGFNYSPALKGKTSEGDWTFEHLDMWLTNPQAFASGTTMAFPGLPDLATRADVIAFLRTKSDNPVPLPEAAAPAAAPAAAAAPKAEEPAPAAAPEASPAAAPEAPKAQATAPAPTPAPETPKAEGPASAPEAPKAEEAAPAPAAETPAAPAPPAETPSEPSPAAETPAMAPSAETPAKKPAPSTETSEPGPASDADTSEPSTANQPQPTYPEGEPQ